MATGTSTDPFLVSDLTITNITNLYLYGTTQAQLGYGAGARTSEQIAALPVDPQTNKPFLNVYADSSSYMTAGAGRYAHASQAPIMQKLFGGSLTLPTSPQGGWTKQDLINLGVGIQDADFRISVNNRIMDVGSADYETRLWVFNNSSFEISDSARFFNVGGSIYVDNLSITPRQDNFDFETASNDGATKFLNSIAGPMTDPYDIGVTVKINYIGTGSLLRPDANTR